MPSFNANSSKSYNNNVKKLGSNSRTNLHVVESSKSINNSSDEDEVENVNRLLLANGGESSNIRSARHVNRFIVLLRRIFRPCRCLKQSHLQRCVKQPLFKIFAIVITLILFFISFQFNTNIQSRDYPLHDWGYNVSRNLSEYIFPMNKTTLLEPLNICKEKIFLLIIVCSGINNFAARQTIRETWGNTTEFNYAVFAQLHAHLHGTYLEATTERLKLYSQYLRINENETTMPPSIIPIRIVFLIGRSKYESFMGNETVIRIRNEAQQYNDIIQENFIDTYNNLTMKSVLALKWIEKRCLKSAAFFMKCDDDTFVNVPNLLHYLLGGTIPVYNDTIELFDKYTSQAMSPRNRLNQTKNFLIGHLFCKAQPVANVSSKWYIPNYMYPGEQYPRYLSGSAYLMTIDVVSRLYEAALNTSLIHLEDVYLTGICAEKIHTRRRHHPLFSYSRAKKLCSFKGSITQHEMKDDSLMEAYLFVTNASNRCSPPSEYFRQIRLRKNNSCM